MNVLIDLGEVLQQFEFQYGSSSDPNSPSVHTIGELRLFVAESLSLNDQIIFKDEFDNVLLDKLDIIRCLYPLQYLRFRSIVPRIKVVMP